jgi:uncharacterized protein (DUF302 family)
MKGIISKQSNHSVKESADRLHTLLTAKGITIYARIDQQAEARSAGVELSPLEFLLFGNPRAGTPIMSAVPLAALDLPLKAIAWQDKDGKVWLSYNEPAYLQQRYGLSAALVKNIDIGPLIEQAAL